MAGVTLNVHWNGLDSLHKLIAEAGLKAPYAIAKAIDEVGNLTKTQVIRSTAAQAGMSYGRVKGTITTKSAMGTGFGAFVITSRDIATSLKEFGPYKTARGVSAAPWRKRRVFPHTFIGPNGHVFVRTGKSRLPLHRLSGPIIPNEMVKDNAAAVFYQVTGHLLPFVLEKWLLRGIGG